MKEALKLPTPYYNPKDGFKLLSSADASSISNALDFSLSSIFAFTKAICSNRTLHSSPHLGAGLAIRIYTKFSI